MELRYVPPTHIDKAWSDGADKLGEACEAGGDEITGDQLKLILARGERTLVQMWDEGIIGWGHYKIEQLPNIRVLFITGLYAPNGHFEQCWEQIKEVARMNGCSRVRCAAKPAQARLYNMKCAMTPVYQIMECEA